VESSVALGVDPLLVPLAAEPVLGVELAVLVLGELPALLEGVLEDGVLLEDGLVVPLPELLVVPPLEAAELPPDFAGIGGNTLLRSFVILLKMPRDRSSVSTESRMTCVCWNVTLISR